MKKLGQDNKLVEELYQKPAEKDAIIDQHKQPAIIAEQNTQIKEKDIIAIALLKYVKFILYFV